MSACRRRLGALAGLLFGASSFSASTPSVQNGRYNISMALGILPWEPRRPGCLACPACRRCSHIGVHGRDGLGLWKLPPGLRRGPRRHGRAFVVVNFTAVFSFWAAWLPGRDARGVGPPARHDSAGIGLVMGGALWSARRSQEARRSHLARRGRPDDGQSMRPRLAAVSWRPYSSPLQCDGGVSR